MSGQYQVIAECCHVMVTDHTGVVATHLLYKGAFIPDGVPADKLKSLIDRGFVAKAGDTPIAPNASVEQDPTRGLESVTEDVLRGEKPQEPAGNGSDVSSRVAEAVAEEGRIDKATEPPRQASDDSEVEAKRAAAKAKLAEVGEPDGRSSQAVWVEYLVARGGSYADLKDVTKADLQKLAEQQK